MKNKAKYILLLLLIPLIFSFELPGTQVVIQQVSFNSNNISTWFFNTGIFNQDLRQTNTPGFQWPKGTGKFACFTAGLCIGGFINNQLREAMCSYKGELAPGYVSNSSGTPVAYTDNRFKIYSVKPTDNYINNLDWLNWGLMVSKGAPFVDVNHNGIFEPLTDTPGVRGASQTLFACLTDGFPEEHKIGEGFGGGTPPLFAEYHITAWCYNNNNSCLQDVQFIKWEIINKNVHAWDSTQFAIVCDPDLGNADDDFIGCDTIRRLSFCYNGDDDDEQGNNTYNYGLHPPAYGIRFLKTARINYSQYLGLTSATYFGSTSCGVSSSACENDPNGETYPAYNMISGVKKDKTPWVIPPGGSPDKKTKFIYSGDPETGQGWNEGIPGTVTGSVCNCGGPDILSGQIQTVNIPCDRRFIMSSGSKYLKVNPGDTQILVAAQLIARGSNNRNSVTKLKQLSDCVQSFYDSTFLIGVNNISTEIPQQYKLYQNYPNPFNPSTTIKFDIQANGKRQMTNVKLVIYDVSGKEAETLIDKELNSGSYSADWNASSFASGVYFYSLIINGNRFETSKMVLLK
jgi:hypothetical protein